MTDKKEQLKEFTLKNPNLSANEIYNGIKGTPLGMRKTDSLKIIRETRNISEPTLAKREASIPIKHRTTKQKSSIAKRKIISKPTPKRIPKVKPIKIPYEQTKFGKIAKRLENKHKISEKRAIERARALLKIPRKDYYRLNKKDVAIILSESP